MNENGLDELTPEQEYKKDIRLCLLMLHKDLVRLADDIKCLYDTLEQEGK